MKSITLGAKRNPKALRIPSWPMRFVAWLLITIQLSWPISPQILYAAPFRSQLGSISESATLAQDTNGNSEVSDLTPPSNDLKFSTEPTDKEIFLARIFNQPIISIGKTANPTENKDLALALRAFQNRQDPDDASAIENFLQAYPNSPRYISLLANLANHYRQTSQFSKALATWQEVWSLGKGVTDPNGAQIVDNAISEWATFLVTLGRADDLKSLVNEIKGRNLHGFAATSTYNAGNALWQMQNKPDKTFKCGPYSLWRVQATLKQCGAVPPAILTQQSTTNGTSLYENWLLSKKIGLNYQMAKRQPGTQVPLPAVVHWKLGHFSALVKKQDERYCIEDPTFNQGFITQRILDEETDGYFLIPAGPLPSGWSTVSEDEAKKVFGRSAPQHSNPGGPGGPPCDSGCCNGMARYNFDMLLISLAISDAPLFYTPPMINIFALSTS